MEDVTVVVRSAGERTEDVCISLLNLQVASENLFIIKEKPFYKAVKRTFEIGLNQNNKWTLAVDADILVNENAVVDMVTNAEKIGDDLYIYQGNIADKLYGICREGGPHLYRTAHLERAMQVLTSDPKVHRPESATYKVLSQEGYSKYVDNKVFGLHDYEQYYRDIFRKAFFYSKKFFNARNLEIILPYWKKNSESDPDLRVALQGWVEGLLNNEETLVDIDYFNLTTKEGYDRSGILEKTKYQVSNLQELNKWINEEIEMFNKQELKVKVWPQKLNWVQKIQSKLGTALVLWGGEIKKSI